MDKKSLDRPPSPALLMLAFLSLAGAEWRPASASLEETRLRLVAAHPHQPRRLLTASDQALYASEDGGQSWSVCLRAPHAARFTSLALDPLNIHRLAAATTNGLYLSTNGGRRWQRVFRGPGGQSQCQVALFHPARRDELLAGTAAGLFVSRDGGRSWGQTGGLPAQRSILALAISPRAATRLYVLTDSGLVVSEDETHLRWKQLGTIPQRSPASEESPEDAEEAPQEPEAALAPAFTSLSVDPRDPQRLYAGTPEGLWFSTDGGMAWRAANRVGVGSAAIQHLLLQAHSPTSVYVATADGIARYRPESEQWDTVTAGLPTLRAWHLASTGTYLLAATDAGLYQLDLAQEQLDQGSWPEARDLLNDFPQEPTISQTQQAAIAYADVASEKIARWRRQAALRALLPTVSLGYNRDQDTYIASSVTTTGTRVFQTDDPSNGTDLRVGWDLGDLIWNGDQTSIDVRSRLMVQLRDDVLDDVTRAYFERRRIEVALLTDPPSDPKAQVDQELRLQELTARLDALTGGWFSEHINGGGMHGTRQ